ncbi:exodeoxyribonuclease V subunit beta [Marichromatium bheemlicum]|uniref:RecBCD enzyme subunit RecB n=1 Tax=Marichromatium bheemlicum TaxID=365339 RepID=A0ABX1I4L5_9GAMM|nr:exodeoxyribonuclease V subunit beta [Marichromatium bheemlicum]NKN32503.1 exodeoxyribonuclease V subunit beta [Marichromatium bheemlicum]
MTAEPNRLDPLAIPLSGARLIEASAGTGKTFTLAMLYLRLVLGHGVALGARTRLQPPEILVVTFTNAATDELRGRIRARLVEAAAAFRAPETAIADPLLARLREEMTAHTDPNLCARHLEQAAEWMDEAAISTIHAWCHRMLREHAFDSGNMFELELENDAAPLLRQAVEDYWRSGYGGLDRTSLAQVHEHWQSPAALETNLVALLGLREHAPPAPSQPPEAIIADVLAARRQRIDTLKREWAEQDWCGQLETLFEEAAARKAFNQRQLNSKHRSEVIARLRDWIADPEAEHPALKRDSRSWQRMSSRAVTEIWKDGHPPVDRPACRALEALFSQLAELPELRPALLAHALHGVAERIEQEKRARALLTQHDLLERLDRALQGAQGARLATTIRRQFPFALVDEFQDTDPLQYRIFATVYRPEENAPETGLFMIGDPKQSIYAFRGADIHTYLRARAATAPRHYSLDTNYRSNPALIAGINALFTQAEQRPGGAFLFRDETADPVPFLPVSPNPARTDDDRLRVNGRPAPVLQAWVATSTEGKPLGKDDYVRRMAESTARTIATLLAAQTHATLGEGRALRAGDIAILVNRHQEARRVRDALHQLGVPSVYLSERSSVYQSQQAQDLLLLLRAVAAPFDERLMRQALACDLIGLPLDQLDRLNHDELYWDDCGERLRRYHQLWRTQGVLPLLYRALADFAIAPRLLARADGERALTDLLHLGELLARASQQLDGEQALVRALEERIQGEGGEDAETQQLRLESDADLVQVITIHKSKGLEYPVVFVPFIATTRQVQQGDLPIKTHDAEGRLQIHLHANPTLIEQADRERLGEDLRKLYVALTRARDALWLGLGPTKDLPVTALGYLLGIDEPLTLEAALKRWPALTTHPEPTPVAALSAPGAAEPLDSARPPPHHPPRPWWITSYSALARRSASTTAPDERETAAQETAFEEALITPQETVIIDPSTATGLHGFPRGSRYGTFLHGLLEWAATLEWHAPEGEPQRSYRAARAATALRRETIARRCNRRGLSTWVDTLDQWLAAYLERTWSLTAIGGTSFSLVDLDPAHLQVELEFWIQARAVDTTVLDTLVRQHIIPGAARPALERQQLEGMLKGFIDLVFEHQGRFYLLDWKSNWLGPDDAAYSVPAMREAVLTARYDLQYALYLLALHRLLRARLPDYDPAHHLGGAIYAFLRGAEAPTQGLYLDRPPAAFITALDRVFAGQGEEAAA